VRIALRIVESWFTELPSAPAARWASLFFSLHVLTLLISVAASQAFLAAAAVAYTVQLLHLARQRDAAAQPALDFPPVKLPVLLFCLATINSVLWAAHPYAGGFALRKLVLFLILLLGVNLVVSRRHLSGLLRGIFLVTAAAGLVGIAQFIIQYDRVLRYHHNRVYFYMTLTRIHGLMGHWMNFGGQQMLVFAALLAYLLLCRDATKSPPQREEGLGGGGGQNRSSPNHPLTPSLARRGITRSGAKALFWLVLAVVATSLVLNFTRGVWLGSLAATMYVLARWKPRMLWAVPLLLIVVGLAGPSLIRRRVSLAFHPREDPALAIRLEMWDVGLRMIREHPWVGVGPGNIPLVYAQYLPPGTTPLYGYHDHLHDNFLQLAAERGLPCLVAWLWFMLGLGWQILRIRRRLSNQRWVADAALAAWLAFLLEGLFEFNFGTTPVLMVFLFVMSTPFIAERVERAADTDRQEGEVYKLG